MCVRGRLPGDSDDASLGRFFRAAGALSEASAGRRGAVWRRRRLAAHHERPSAAERAREGALRPLPVLGEVAVRRGRDAERVGRRRSTRARRAG